MCHVNLNKGMYIKKKVFKELLSISIVHIIIHTAYQDSNHGDQFLRWWKWDRMYTTNSTKSSPRCFPLASEHQRMTLWYNNHEKKVTFLEFHTETSQITMTTKVKIIAEMRLSVQPGQCKNANYGKSLGEWDFLQCTYMADCKTLDIYWQ